MARAVDAPFTKNSADHPRALQPAFERCATPLTMGTAICFTPSTRVRGGVPLGAPTRLSCAGAGVSSGLAAAVKVRMGKSKLRKIEANTVLTHVSDFTGCTFYMLTSHSPDMQTTVRWWQWCLLHPVRW